MRLIAICGVTFLLTACGMAESPRNSVVVDSAGVRVVRSSAPAWTKDGGWHVEADPVLSIGPTDGPPAYTLHEVGALRRLSDGRIVVADNGSATLRYYDAAGKHLLTVGRRGSGPGEFQRISGLQRLAADSLMIWDARLGRATFLDGSGNRVGELAFRGGSGPAMLWRLTDGRWVASTQSGLTAAGGAGLHRQSAYVMLLPSDLTRPDTVGRFPGTEYAVVDFGSGFGMGVAPYARVFATTVEGDRVYVATGERLGWEAYLPDGTLVERVHSEVLDLSLSERDRPSIKAAALEEVSSEEDRRFVGDYYDRVALPPARSAFSSMLIDTRGAVWLEDSDARTGIWRVHDVAGQYLGEVKVPVGFDAREIGDDYLLGVWHDELGVETLRMLRLVRNE